MASRVNMYNDEHRAGCGRGTPILVLKSFARPFARSRRRTKADDRHGEHRPAPLTRAPVALHPIASQAEHAEQKPGQRMRPDFAAQGLGDVDGRREHGERDREKAQPVPPINRPVHRHAPRTACEKTGSGVPRSLAAAASSAPMTVLGQRAVETPGGPPTTGRSRLRAGTVLAEARELLPAARAIPNRGRPRA